MPLFRRVRAEPWLPALLVAVGAVGLMLLPSSQAPLTGRAFAVDGDTLRLGGERIRLTGLDAPELGQTCSDQAGASWPCGETARRKMISVLADAAVTCAPHGRDRYGRILATCTTGAVDVGEAVVEAGLAISDGGYLAAEAVARGAHRGIWAGRFMAPAEWRREQESDTRAANWIDLITSWLR